MATGILVIGQSGTGKSTSIMNLPPEATFIINVAGKPLPFKGWKAKYPLYKVETKTGNLFNSDNPAAISVFLQGISAKRPEIKYIIIDDAQYLMANEYMRRSREKGYDKFTDISSNLFSIVDLLRNLRDDLFICFMFHAEIDSDELGTRMIKAKTIGKAFDRYITLEGLFSIVLYTNVQKEENGKLTYSFLTQNSGNNTGKSPLGMFESPAIPNDLAFVFKAIEAYELEA